MIEVLYMKDKLKNKKVIAGIISGIAVITVVVIAMIILSQPKLVVKAETMDIEYGNEISTKAEDYLDIEKVDKDIIAKTNVTVDISNHDKSDNEYISIGEYLVKLTYEDETVEVKVNVKDTTKPTFDKFEKEIEITKDCKPAGEELNKLLEKFSAKDLQKVTISLDDSKVDYSKEGAYKATVKAIDASKNESTQETTIKIVKPTIKLDKKSESVYAKESFVLKTTITGKEDKATFKSSNSSIASVDANGKVSAKKKGTATITATANGVNAECKVTVKSVPSGSNTEKKTVTNPNTGKKEEVVVVKPSTPSGSSGSGSSNSNSTLTASISMEAFNEINRQRANLGRSQLELASEWTEIAKKRAKEITVNFSHDGLDKYFSPHTVGECCSFGHGGAIATVKNGWMQSQNHKAILMDPENTKLIVANYGDYWVALVK
jgi:uncharacterized protein YkwD